MIYISERLTSYDAQAVMKFGKKDNYIILWATKSPKRGFTLRYSSLGYNTGIPY